MSTLKVNNITDLGDDAVVTSGVIPASALPAGSIISVKNITKTDTFSASVAEGGNVAVDGLSITHALSNPANKLLITAFFGQAANSNGRSSTGIAVNDGTALISIGDADGVRTRTTAGGLIQGTTRTDGATMPHITIMHEPGDTSSRTYTVHAVNITGAQTIYVNRTQSNNDTPNEGRGASGLTIMEVAG